MLVQELTSSILYSNIKMNAPVYVLGEDDYLLNFSIRVLNDGTVVIVPENLWDGK